MKEEKGQGLDGREQVQRKRSDESGEIRKEESRLARVDSS